MESIPPESERLFTWKPNPRQKTFLASGVFECLFGGAAGPGKSEALLVAPLRWVGYPRFNGIVFRRTFPELNKSLIPRSHELYPAVVPGARYNSTNHEWRFPSGARIYFGHLEHETSVFDHRSSEYQFIGFDELTMFTEQQYVYLLSRARSGSGLPIRIRSASNPGGPGHEWVFKRWGRWLNPEHEERLGPDEVTYYINSEEGEKTVERGTPGALSRQFIPGLLEDNPYANTLEYRQQLLAQDPVTRRQLLHGDWLVRPAAGLYFQRKWFTELPCVPHDVKVHIRRWDLAATENGGDWTVGVRMSMRPDGTTYIDDVVRCRHRPEGVRKKVLETAEADGVGVTIVLPQDPGQAGIDQCEFYAKLLLGYDVRFERETGDKLTRARPFSAQCEAGNVFIIRGHWYEPFMQCLEAFGEVDAKGKLLDIQDDDVDAASGAFNFLVQYKKTAFERWQEMVDDTW